jgi:uncharacterized membrane protein YidH (DUF202 family)
MNQVMPTLLEPRGERPGLAEFNIKLALDRTTLSWISTSLTMASFGFGMVAFFRTLQQRSPSAESEHLHQGAIHFGVALIVVGLVAMMCAGLSHWFILRRIQRGEVPALSPWPLSISVALLFSVIGLVGLWELLS